MKRRETRTLSVTYYIKTMYQVSVEYVKGYGKMSEKPQVGWKDRQRDGETDRQTDTQRANHHPVKPGGD